MATVLITPSVLFKSRGRHVEMLCEAGFEVSYPQGPTLSSEIETIRALLGISATLAGGEPYNERVLASVPQLRVISRWGVGVDQIDMDAAIRHGVAVTITPGSNHKA